MGAGGSALHRAAADGDLERVKRYLNKRQEPNVVGYGNIMPLHRACSGGHEAVAQFLVESGADVNAKCFVNGFNGIMPLHCACSGEGHLGIIQLLVKNGAIVNSQDDNGMTALMFVVAIGNYDCAKYLIEKGAAVNAKIKKGEMTVSLHEASRNGHHSVAQLLIENGASLNEKDSNDNTPVHLACINGHIVVLKVLVESGADLSIKNKKGWTPIHEAIAKGGNNHKIIQYLVDVMGKDRSHVELVELLDAPPAPPTKQEMAWNRAKEKIQRAVDKAQT